MDARKEKNSDPSYHPGKKAPAKRRKLIVPKKEKRVSGSSGSRTPRKPRAPRAESGVKKTRGRKRKLEEDDEGDEDDVGSSTPKTKRAAKKPRIVRRRYASSPSLWSSSSKSQIYLMHWWGLSDSGARGLVN